MATGLCHLLLFRCVELWWGLCCAVLSPWPIVAPSPSVVPRLGFCLWCLFGLGLVGCGPAGVPAFFFFGGGGTLLPLSWWFSLGSSYSLVVQAPCVFLKSWLSACVGPGGCPSFSLVRPAPSHWVPLLWTGWCGRLQPFSFSSVFLRDVVTLWVNSVFLSLLITNEGLH